jgi:hypothetical protein
VAIIGEYCQTNGGVVALAFSAGSNDKAALLSVCTLAQIDEYTRLEVGVGLTVRGVCRVEITEVLPPASNQQFSTVKVEAFEDAYPKLPGPTPTNSNETAVLEAEAEAALAAQVEALYLQDEALLAAEEESGLASASVAELSVDPRAILEPGQRLADVASEIADAYYTARAKRNNAKKQRSAKKNTANQKQAGLQEAVFNPVDDDPDWALGRLPAAPGGSSLRFKAATARATQTKNPFAAASPQEVQLERSLASFLALGGGGLRAKLKGFLSRDLADRLALAAATLAERAQLLAAKRALRSIVGSSSGSSGDGRGDGSSSTGEKSSDDAS